MQTHDINCGGTMTGGPPIIAGMWHLAEKLDAAGWRDFIKGCLDRGVNTFDHADIYGAGESEAQFGQAWKALGIPREQMILLSKCGNIQPGGSSDPLDVKHYDTSHDYIIRSTEAILTRLQTDYLDLLMLHRYDALANYAEIARAFEKLRDSGKVKRFGVSNFAPVSFMALDEYLGGRALAAHQFECSIFQPAAVLDGTLDLLQARRREAQAWSPLGGNFDARLAANPALDTALRTVAERDGDAALTTTALRWLLTHPAGIRPVIGTSRIDRLEQAVAATHRPLDRAAWFSILQASRGEPMP